jgi:hypothetical protein
MILLHQVQWWVWYEWIILYKEEIYMVFDRLFKLFMSLQIFIFRRTQGKAMSCMRGMPVLLLNNVGRKTGQPRTTPLMYIRDGDDYVITASNSDRDKHPAWFRNQDPNPKGLGDP